MTEEQAKAFVKLVGFEIDMTFKGTVGDINEWVVAAYDRKAQLTLTYARVFTNAKTAEAYFRIFDTLAEVIRGYTGSYPVWRHIHGEGLVYVLADFDSAQAKGLGMHLHKIESTRTAEDHLQHVFLTCLVHFHRALDQKHFAADVKRLMARIPYLEDDAGLDQVLADLKARPQKEVKDWLEFYLQPWVLSSLSPTRTKVPQDIFKHLIRNTNASESNHANSNRSGKRMSLHATVFSCMTFDNARWAIAEVHKISGIGPSNKSSVRKRMEKKVKADEKRNEKRQLKYEAVGNPKKRNKKREPIVTPIITSNSEAGVSHEKEIELLEKRMAYERMQQETLRLKLALREEYTEEDKENDIEFREHSSKADVKGKRRMGDVLN